eukprot:103799_1
MSKLVDELISIIQKDVANIMQHSELTSEQKEETDREEDDDGSRIILHGRCGEKYRYDQKIYNYTNEKMDCNMMIMNSIKRFRFYKKVYIEPVRKIVHIFLFNKKEEDEEDQTIMNLDEFTNLRQTNTYTSQTRSSSLDHYDMIGSNKGRGDAVEFKLFNAQQQFQSGSNVLSVTKKTHAFNRNQGQSMRSNVSSVTKKTLASSVTGRGDYDSENDIDSENEEPISTMDVKGRCNKYLVKSIVSNASPL